MAKTSVVNRNNKRMKLSAKLRAKRTQLKKAVCDIHADGKSRWEAMLELQKLPRDSSPVRRRNRCKLCGRPRGYNRLTGLCRLHMRIATIGGMVPGMHKASW